MEKPNSRLELDYFWGADGHRHDLFKCSVSDLPQLARLFRILGEELQRIFAEKTKYPSMESCYLQNYRFRELCHEILRLNGIQPDWVNLDQLLALCVVDGDNPAQLMVLNSLDASHSPEPKTEEETTLEETINKMMGSFLSSGMTFEDAQKMFSEKSLEDIQQIFKGMHPEIEKKQQEKNEKHELLNHLDKSFASPKTFKAKPRAKVTPYNRRK